MNLKSPNLKLGLVVLIVAALCANLFFLFNVGRALGLTSWKGELTDLLPAWRDQLNKKSVQKYQLITVVNSDCKECSSLADVLQFIHESDVKVTKDQTVDLAQNKDEAQALIDKYKLDKLPALIIKGPQVPNDPELAQFVQSFAEVMDKDLVLKRVQPPYWDLATSQVKGKFKVTYLSDKSCENCYDVLLHRNAFERLSMRGGAEVELDVADDEGKALLKKYNILVVPTILVEGELDLYPSFQQVWPTVGSKEEDGVYIFRDGVSQMGPYKDLKTGKVVVPPAEEIPATQ